MSLVHPICIQGGVRNLTPHYVKCVSGENTLLFHWTVGNSIQFCDFFVTHIRPLISPDTKLAQL